MEESDLYAAVRAGCGKIEGNEELEDIDILRESVFIMKRIDERITDRVLRYFEGEINVREYDPHANTVRVQKVYDSDTLESDTMVLGSHHREEFNPDTSEYYLFPSTYIIRMQRRIRGLPSLQWGWNAIRRKIIIDPMPSQTGDKYWYISVERTGWTLANIPEGFEELLVTGCVWKCLEIVLLKRSDLGGIQREGGFVDYPASAMKGFIDTKKDEFFDTLKLKSNLYGSR